MLTVNKPTEEQRLMYASVLRELKKRSNGTLSVEEIALIVANFVNNYDFSNPAIAHKSAGGWAKLLVRSLEQ